MNISLTIQDVFDEIENHLGCPIIGKQTVSGGWISETYKLITEKKPFFLKYNSQYPQLFEKEKNGLEEIRKSNTICTPKVHIAKDGYILMDYIEESVATKDFFARFGKKMANLHSYHNERFGFYEDNYVGCAPQENIASGKEKISWIDFFFNKRLLAQYRMAEKNGYATQELLAGIMQLEKKIPQILDGSEEAPALLHGDFWGSNFLVAEDGNPILIDTGTYYGHREADFAMTKMFGGFPEIFFRSYEQAYPFKEGFEYRQNLYKLHHILNHLNLFGTSYYQQAMGLINSYL